MPRDDISLFMLNIIPVPTDTDSVLSHVSVLAPHWRLCFVVHLLLTDPPAHRDELMDVGSEWLHLC